MTRAYYGQEPRNLSLARESGAAARRAGYGADRCRMREGTRERECWLEGWEQEDDLRRGDE